MSTYERILQTKFERNVARVEVNKNKGTVAPFSLLCQLKERCRERYFRPMCVEKITTYTCEQKGSLNESGKRDEGNECWGHKKLVHTRDTHPGCEGKFGGRGGGIKVQKILMTMRVVE
jgi:hypothetical protein